jgi:hypothetical protein
MRKVSVLRRRRPIAAAAIVLGLLCASSALALHQESPGVVRITATGSHDHSSGRSWGNWLAFTSTQDLAGTGNTSQQVFLFNMAYYDCWHGSTLPTTPCPNPLLPFIKQATNRPGSPANPSVTIESVDGISQWLAFDADGTLLGDTSPASQHRQIFLKDVKTEELRQVTFGTDGDSVRPSVSSLAGLVVFESTATLEGFPSNGVRQVFAYEREFALLHRITNGQGPSSAPMTNKIGTLIAFESTADLLGDGHDTGVSQIFWAEYDRLNHLSIIRRLTAGNGPSRKPYLSEDTKLIAFESEATDLPGTPGGTQVYISSAIDGASVVLSQVTYQSRFGDCTDPALDPGGDRIGFICSGDPLDNDTSGRRLFVLDLCVLRESCSIDQPRLFQITGAGDVQPPIALSLGRWFVSLSTTSDLTGLGSCGYQLHVIDYFLGEPGHWNAATAPGQLPPDVQPVAGSPPPGNLIGRQTMEFLPGDPVIGSQMIVTTRDGQVRAGLEGAGRMVMIGGAPAELTHLASVRVREADLVFPAVSVPGVGMVCLRPRGDGGGFVDCDGGNAGGRLLVAKDHNTLDNDPACALGCREGEACQGPLVGPHTGVCNGPTTITPSGATRAGEMQLLLPLALSLPRAAGLDLTWCTADDDYALRDVPINISLTTGTQDTVILDSENVQGASLAITTTGSPFSCPALQAGVMTGVRLEGAVPVLDVPGVPGVRDVILGLRLEPKPDPICSAPCIAGSDCDDGDACNGIELCVSGKCASGTPVTCDDGTPIGGTTVTTTSSTSTTSPSSVTTTSSTSTTTPGSLLTSTPTTSTLPCTSVRCQLDADLARAGCATETIPVGITKKLDRATRLIEMAADTPKKARRLVKRAKAALKQAARAAARATKGKRAKLSPGCASAIRQTTDRVRGGLGV